MIEPLTLAAMLAAFGLLIGAARWPIGVSLAVAAWAGAALNGHFAPLRHLVEGAFSYLDAMLVIATAMLFMRALADAGALAAIGRVVERRFGGQPWVLLPTIMLIVMFPGMMTGSSTASVLTTGAMAVSILHGLSLSRARAAALVAMGGVLGMIAPPVNIPAMLIGGGLDLPYTGFGAPLAIAAFPAALALSYGLGWPVLRGRRHPGPAAPDAPGGRDTPRAAIEGSAVGVQADPARPGARAGGDSVLPLWRAVLPVAVVVLLMVAPAAWPRSIRDPGLPLTFVAAALVAWLVQPRLRIAASLVRATDEALPVLGILTGVGAFIQVMTLTGARGWLVALILGAPSWAIFAAAAVSLPLFGAVSAFGSASVLGVPFLLALIGRDEIVTTAALSALAGLGDLMLPAALAATLAARVAGLEDRGPVLRLCVMPALVVVATAVILLVLAPQVGAWLR